MVAQDSLTNALQLESLTWREQDVLSLLGEHHTNREIAQILGLELTTVKWYNKQIFDKLGVENRRAAAARAEELGLLDKQPGDPTGMPAEPERTLPAQITSFVGRERELAEVKRLLQTARLVTLTGPAGTGKTRLALQAVAELADADDTQDGVCFVDLSPISQPELVADAIANALGVKETAGRLITDSLKIYLANKKTLLLLDNFEQVIESAPLVIDLLSVAPDLKVLITTREALRIYGEQEYPVPPLALPDLERSEPLPVLSKYESVALFIHRAQAVKPDFHVTDEDARFVAEICVRLDGLPLALELAAARVKLFSAQTLLGQMESRFTALRGSQRGVPARQQTLRGAITWSYELLDDAEKVLFARLSVFQGGRTIQAVEAVCSYDLPIDVLDGLESLVNKNLLRVVEGPEGEPRFVMLETIHEYAREKLQDSGEAEDIHRRHAEYFTALAERAEPHTRGGAEQMRWLRRLEAEHDNLRAMFRWSMRGGGEFALRLVGTLGYFWWRQGHYAEGQQWTARALEVSGDAPPAVRANIFFAAGIACKYRNEVVSGKRMFRKALELYRELGAQRDIGYTLTVLSYLSVGRQDEYEEAVALCEEGLALLREADVKSGVAQAFNNLGELARLQGDLPRAKEAYEESLNVAREIGDGLRESILLINLGLVAQHEGDSERAQALFRQILTMALEIGHMVLKVDTLAYLAGATGALGHLKRAARLFGAAEALYNTHGFSLQGGDMPEFERNKASVLQQMGPDAFEAAWTQGQAMSVEEAIAYALETESE
jgi:non-specific serine/threonine protein kinase